VNPSTAFGVTFADELIRCGLRDVVVAPGSRSTPLAMAFADADLAGRLRLHVRIDERSASYAALGLARASGRPAAVLCTSGTAAANFHPAVMEADESGVPLLVLTADRPPELRGTGANQTVDQIKLYGCQVRWFAEAGVPEARAGSVTYWRSLACQAWAMASAAAGGFPGPVHVNLPLREPLVPDGTADWPESLDGRPGGEPWTRFAVASAGDAPVELPWTARGVIVCGDGDYDSGPLLDLAARAGWPVLAEPSSGARHGANAICAYEYLLARPEFRPDVVISAGRPGLSRPQSALLALGSARHIVIAQGPGRWADAARRADAIATRVTLTGAVRRSSWLGTWRDADIAVRRAVDAVLDDGDEVTEPRLARDLARAVGEGALLWAGNSLAVRDLDFQMPARADVRVLANRGTSGIDGSTSAAIGAALAHHGPAYALIGDLALVHDAPGLALGPSEPRPDLCLIVVNNDGGGIFSTLEPAGTPGFERVFGTPHGTDIARLAAAFGVPYQRLERPGDLPKAIQGTGLRIVEARTDRDSGAALRTRLRGAAAGA
jgi:2-succinyl-5-enolpyruvyl-6-hydroxy-3-cyclohexene-1-carboxylate synthase